MCSFPETQDLSNEPPALTSPLGRLPKAKGAQHGRVPPSTANIQVRKGHTPRITRRYYLRLHVHNCRDRSTERSLLLLQRARKASPKAQQKQRKALPGDISHQGMHRKEPPVHGLKHRRMQHAPDACAEGQQRRPHRSKKVPKKFADFTQGQGLDAAALEGGDDAATLDLSPLRR